MTEFRIQVKYCSDNQTWEVMILLGFKIIATASGYVNRVDALSAVLSAFEQQIMRDKEEVFNG